MFYVLRFMNKTCKNCKQTFEIAPDDATFYEKVNVPAPRFCPPCRTQRRLLHRNERTLYRRPCDRCGADGVSIYPVGTPWPVYCNPCWWGDAWDGKSFGMEYNPAKSFFDQYRELLNKVPRINLLCITSVNSEYTNNSADNKNCYLLFAAEKNQDCMYGRLVSDARLVVIFCFAMMSGIRRTAFFQQICAMLPIAFKTSNAPRKNTKRRKKKFLLPKKASKRQRSDSKNLRRRLSSNTPSKQNAMTRQGIISIMSII